MHELTIVVRRFADDSRETITRTDRNPDYLAKWCADFLRVATGAVSFAVVRVALHELPEVRA